MVGEKNAFVLQVSLFPEDAMAFGGLVWSCHFTAKVEMNFENASSMFLVSLCWDTLLTSAVRLCGCNWSWQYASR